MSTTPENSPMQGPDSEELSLLNKRCFTPTSSRPLQGWFDLARILVGAVWFVSARILRLLRRVLGLEHRRRKRAGRLDRTTSALVDNQGSREVELQGHDGGVAALRAALVASRSGELQSFASSPSPCEVWVLADDDSSTGAEVVVTLKAAHCAYRHCLKTFSLLEEDEGSPGLHQSVECVLHDLLDGDHAPDYPRAITQLRSLYHRQLLNACKAVLTNLEPAHVLGQFQFFYLMHHSNHVPSRMHRRVMELDDGGELLESCELLQLWPAEAYLQAKGSGFHEYLDLMAQFGQMRPSGAKKQPQVQAMPVNARYHRVHSQHHGKTTWASAVLRCGAFTLHGRKPRHSMMRLKEELQNWATENAAQKLGFTSIKHLQQDVEHREALLVAQALPVLLGCLEAGLRQIAFMQAAWHSGSFLVLQQCLLSDLDSHERVMLQDIQSVLAVLSERVLVQFRPDAGRGSLELTADSIILTLDSDRLSGLSDMAPGEGGASTFACSPAQFAERVFNVTWLLVSQGVNLWQSLGFLRCIQRKLLLQDQINEAALAALNEYARMVGSGVSHRTWLALQALNTHFSEQGSRAPKDLEGLRLFREAVRELGGVRVVNCKSGKDRTAMEICATFAAEAAQQGVAPVGSERFIRERLMAGLSYAITNHNHGQPNTYAFNELELMCLPPGWGPPWKLCSNIDS